MGKILDTLRANRESYRQERQERASQRATTRAEARKAYDQAYREGAIDAVRSRAKREAKERYGVTNRERVQRGISSISKELGGLGEWGVGNTRPARARARTHSHRKKSRHYSKHRRAAPRRGGSNPFDLGDMDDVGELF